MSVTSASGIEAVTKRELETLGYEAGPAVFGRIGFNGDMTALARANMFLRTANHVYVNLFSFKATTFDELFDGLISYPFEDVLKRTRALPSMQKAINRRCMRCRQSRKSQKGDCRKVEKEI